MGGSQSKVKSVTDVVQEATKDIVMNNTATCTAASSLNQTMQIKGIKAGLGCDINISNLGQKAKLEVNLNCVQKQGNSAELQTKFDAAIDEKIKSESEAGLGLSNSEIDQMKKIKQKIKTNIKMSSVASCLASTFAKQDIVINDVSTGDCVIPTAFGVKRISDGISIKNIQQNAVIKTTAKCVQDQMNSLSDIADMKVAVVSDTSSSAKGIDVNQLIMLLIILACVLVGGYVFFKLA